MDRDKIIKMVVLLAAIVVIAGGLSKVMHRNSMSLAEYAKLNNLPVEGETGSSSESSGDDPADSSSSSSGNGQTDSSSSGSSGNSQTDSSPSGNVQAGSSPSGSSDNSQMGSSPSGSSGNNYAGSSPSGPSGNSQADSSSPAPENGLQSSETQEGDNTPSKLTGATLNGDSCLEQRCIVADGFYYEPVSDALRRYMTGISYPAAQEEESAPPEITFEELRYVHILHYDFEGNSAEGELICNEFIAQDLAEIFHELYRNEYRLEKVLLIDEYDGSDNASMEDNNTSCFNYRPVEGTTQLSKHAFGLAVDINPLYNPYIAYAKDGSENILPVSAANYADRSINFPYKIDENDLCYKLFLQHGFTWGGNWNNVKDYQHFQKTP